MPLKTIDSPHSMGGLSQAEASSRFQQEGPNELSKAQKRTSLTIILEVLREPMFLLLIASSGIYALLGDTHESLMLMSMIFIVIGITFYQENKTEHTLEALRDLSSPKALVIRDGQQKQISGREVVRGDLVLLLEGDRIPADGLLLSGPGLSIDESLLTGESVPVRKNPGESDASALYAGTLVVQGQGVLQVSRIGMHTELGKIGRSLESLVTEDTSLQKETRKLVRLFGAWGALLCVLVLVAYGLIRGDWMHGLLAGITLAMSVMPEEFPMVLTVFLALGAWRIAKSKVLTRRSHAIEALGTCTVLCTDKTGTLTMNRMEVVRIAMSGEEELVLQHSSETKPMSQPHSNVVYFAGLASQWDSFDPMDRATVEAGEKHLPNEWLHKQQNPAKLYPISKELLAVTQVWEVEKNCYTVATKGAPETILDLCQIEASDRKAVTLQLQKMARDGLRVLGVAKARWEKGDLPDTPHHFPFEFVGLIGYMDPIRPDVPDAIQACHTAGIRVIMITGDYPETASSIAQQIGLYSPENIITGAMLSELSDEELTVKIKSVSTFARMRPEQKLRLVNALKANNDIVAMTGDGVNDAPALKAAHIGIAMGKRGTDVAREAAHLVLLNDDFSSIVQSIRLGRRIFDNLRKAMAYIFSIHIPIAGMVLLPVLMDWPLILFPAHIALLEMVIDPACSVAFEAEASEQNVMNRPPRPIQEPLFSKWTFINAILQGNIMLLIILAVYGYALSHHYEAASARSMAFITLLLSNLMLITVNLSGQSSIFKMPFLKNKAYWWVLFGALAALVLVLAVPFLRKLFYFDLLAPADYGICVGATIASLLSMELVKQVTQRFQKKAVMILIQGVGIDQLKAPK